MIAASHLGLRIATSVLLGLMAVITPALNGQTAKERTARDFLEKDISPFIDPRIQTSQNPGLALESVIDPAKYVLGPSDVLYVGIGDPPSPSFSLTVTPEGYLVIPTVGAVQVADIELAVAKDLILKEVQKRYKTKEGVVQLLSPRSIVLMVTGNVLNKGLYTLSAVDRVHRALEEANKPTRLQTQEDADQVIATVSTRNIVVRHKDGTSSRVDIQKFLATKHDQWNPYLREGDVVIVPRKNPAKNVFAIYGEVNAPGRYEFVDGDSALDAVKIGQGLTRLARADSAELHRLNSHASSLSVTTLDLRSILAGGGGNIALEPGDRIVVKARVELREDYRVTIQGEVPYPGTYPITKDRTKLSWIIAQAGGFTSHASLSNAEIIRSSVSTDEINVERLMSLRGSIDPEDSSYYHLETDIRLRKEAVNVDMLKLFVNGDSAHDVLLQSGDDIIIPSGNNTVYVFGQVVLPGHVSFGKGRGVPYYIERAGGFTEQARRGDLRVVKAKTRQWLSPDETVIEPGDYIWVPKDPERSFAYYMTVMSQAASILSVVLGVAVIVVQISK